MWKPSVESNTRHKFCIVYLMTLWNTDHVDTHGKLKSAGFVFCLCFICSSIFSCYHWILSSFIIHQTKLLCMKSVCEMIECIVLWNAVWWVAELVWCGWCIWRLWRLDMNSECNTKETFVMRCMILSSYVSNLSSYKI